MYERVKIAGASLALLKTRLARNSQLKAELLPNKELKIVSNLDIFYIKADNCMY